MKIGAQFFTIRDFCKNLDDFSLSLKKVADIGYEYVQISGVCDYEPEWLKKELKKNGLKCVLTHNKRDMLTNDIKTVINNHNVFDCKYIGLGGFALPDGEERENLEDFIKSFKPVVKEIKENGKYFMYHNHHREYKKLDGITIMEHLKNNFAPDELGFTLDTYWVQVGGADPAQWLEILSGRVPCIHLKDCAYEQKMSVIGEGNINFDRVFEKAEKAGTEYMLVEQDNCNGENPFDCLERSYKYLRSCGF